MNLVIELHVFPCTDYFLEILASDNVYLEAFENFQKQSYRNRFSILTANKIDFLTVPVVKANKKTLITEIEIDYASDWQKNHWRTIQSAYGKSPFFEYYSAYIKALYDKKPRYLWEFNLEALTVCLKLLGVKKEIFFTSTYNKEGENTVLNYIDKRSVVHQKKDRVANNIVYTQSFGREFAPNLSIIDLIFNAGPQSRLVLEKALK